jgi:ABC-type transporter Mla MlaB component
VLRITTRDAGDGYLLTVEGRLTGVWVAELEASWRAARRSPAGAIRVDLCEVDMVDAAGRYLLALMHESGAELVARGCAMSALIREITGDAPGVSPAAR